MKNYLFLCIAFLLIVSCDNTPKKQRENVSAEKISLTDMAERKVLVPKSISKAFIDRPPGLGRVMGSIWLASLTYPDYFRADIVPITQEFFKKFYHYDMDYIETREIISAQITIDN
jgi:ABC transporter, substrate-binding protein